jgi:hypothetical protein
MLQGMLGWFLGKVRSREKTINKQKGFAGLVVFMVIALITVGGIYYWTESEKQSVQQPVVQPTKPSAITNQTSSSTPTIKVVYPNGGESFKIGDTVPITWSVYNAPTGARVSLYLTTYPEKPNDFIARDLLPDSGVYQWKIPNEYGKYKDRIQFFEIIANLYIPTPSLPTPSPIAYDASDNSFNINPPPPSTPMIYHILPAGCTFPVGNSSVNSVSCSTTRTSANFNERVYIYGSGFGQFDDTYVNFGPTQVKIAAIFHSSSIIAFDVPPAWIGSGTYEITISHGSIQSNKVNLIFTDK